LKSRPLPVEERELAEAQRKVGQLQLEVDILQEEGVRVWVRRLLGVERAVVEGVELDEDGSLVVAVRPNWRAAPLRGLPAALSGLRRGRGQEALAGAGSGHEPLLAGGGGAQGRVRAARQAVGQRPLWTQVLFRELASTQIRRLRARRGGRNKGARPKAS